MSSQSLRTSAPTIHRLPTDQFASGAARIIGDAVCAAVASRGHCFVALSGGSTPGAIYSVLGADNRIPWEKVTCFLGDERCVNATDPQSNTRLVRETLQKGGTPGARCRLVAPDTEVDPTTGAVRYADALLKELGQRLSFDVMLLGVGEDGHTASIFPGSEFVTESPEYYVVARHPQNFSMRISLTRKILERSAATFFLAKGSAKKRIIEMALDATTPESQIPTKIFRTFTGSVDFVLDEAAAPQ